MAELINKKLVLKNIASFAIGCDPQEEPMANVDHIGMSIEDLPTVTEAEIRAKAIDEFLREAEQWAENIENVCRGSAFLRFLIFVTSQSG